MRIADPVAAFFWPLERGLPLLIAALLVLSWAESDGSPTRSWNLPSRPRRRSDSSACYPNATRTVSRAIWNAPCDRVALDGVANGESAIDGVSLLAYLPRVSAAPAERR